MRYALLYLSLFLASSLAHAVSESDFAYGYTLEVDGDGAIYSLPLPEAVYRGLVRADRGDLRVFNSEGVSVPHHLERADRKLQQTSLDVTLPMYPLYSDAVITQNPGVSGVHVVTDDNGAIIDINYGQLPGSGNHQVRAYLLDCSQLTQAANALIINWKGSQTEFAVNAEVEGSDDLAYWQPVIVRSTLSDIHYDGQALIQRRIDLPLHKFKYLRLVWLDHKSLLLASVMARFPTTYQAQDRQWSTFGFSRYDRKHKTYFFDTHSVLPADRVNVDLPRHNTLLQAKLASAPTQKGPWTLRYNGLLYNLYIDGNELRTPAQVIHVTSNRYWRLQILGKGIQLHGKPVLRLGWIPELLYFVARGEAPFTLAYGSDRVGPADTPLRQLLDLGNSRNQQQFIKPAQLGSSIELGNKDILTTAGPEFDWERIVLWLVLLFGVAALVFIARQLYKQMDRTGPNE